MNKYTFYGMAKKLIEFNDITDTGGAEFFLLMLKRRFIRVQLYLYITGVPSICFWSDWFDFDLQFTGSYFKFSAWWRGEAVLKQGDHVGQLSKCPEFWEILKRIGELEACLW